MDIKCKYCGRFLFKQMGTVVIESLICPNSKCKAVLNFKIVSADREKDIRHQFINKEIKGKESRDESN